MKEHKLKSFAEKLFKTKGMGFILIGLAAGVLLLVFPTDAADGTDDKSVLTAAEYCSLLEQKATRLIKELPEVSECSVFITLESGYKYVYATDQHIKDSETAKETDKTIVLASASAGSEAPILISETMPKVAGIAIVIPNSSYETQYRVVELMCALFDIKSNRISVKN